MKLLFIDKTDIHNVWGQVKFGVTPLKRVADCENPGFSVGCCTRLDDGSYDVLGSRVGRNVPWQLYRATTRDGIHFENTRMVHEQSGTHWSYTARMCYSPELQRYLCMKNGLTDEGFNMHIFTSRDGETWRGYEGNPVFAEGDNWGVMWSPAVQQFISYSKGIQRYEGKRVNELFLNARRVVTIRTSPDGFTWTPDLPSHYRRGMERRNGMRLIHAPLIPPEYQISPDELDPPDLEFYVAEPFEYEGRYFMTASNYAGSFIPPGISPMREDGHGTSLGTELWISRDGLHWERPFRHINMEGMSSHNPMRIGGRILFRTPDSLLGVPEDRLTYLTSWSNGIFETPSFSMTDKPLRLNAKIPGDDYRNDGNQAYIMAELIDERDQAIPEYEKEECLLQGPIDSLNIELKWNGRNGTDLSGTRVRVRFYMRASNIYAVTSDE